MTTTPEPYVQATRYEVSLLPPDDINRPVFTIDVEYRGRGLWAAVRHHQCLNAKGEWSYELRPSEREDEWLAAHRFDLDTAQQLAKQAAPHLIVNGRTALDIYRRNPPQHIGGNAEDCPACHGTNPDYPFICPGPPAA
ncbi:hypothetical protein [Streptomyces scabiei]|uniref:hypothetical protein n=1 Tax=Streptomyces scabiei TaxID=1930 RepID=UPI001B303B7E|nr:MULTISPECIES: hypothetical protein [Streptomyces]MDX2794631.1 hypothetical protein [Streptomyces scabiei]MDX3822367.1 hypothetical protein [Streptomyces scabiei]QTU57375.1 hypothetical protein F3K21_35120 [Streptomyces sp. LBUM 1480]